jgi:hypothetical protein
MISKDLEMGGSRSNMCATLGSQFLPNPLPNIINHVLGPDHTIYPIITI